MSTFSVVKKVRQITALCPLPWLVVGKGPSCGYISRVDPARYHVLTLNHACRVVEPSIAHFTDLEAFFDCVPTLDDRKCAYCLPWYPHVGNAVGRKTLNDHGPAVRPKGLGDLVSYNSSLAHKLPRNAALPDVRVRHFSAVAAFNILALAGIREIASIGVDGGTGYAEGFDPKDRLANGRKSFDPQTKEITNTVTRNGIHWTRLGE